MLTYGSEARTVWKRDESRLITSKIKFMRRAPAYTAWIIKGI
jgi:hypothetical protein